ncbi:MAG TPA: hypothetical protein VF575_05810 [Candidatus Saccharimonadales bacterium]
MNKKSAQKQRRQKNSDNGFSQVVVTPKDNQKKCTHLKTKPQNRNFKNKSKYEKPAPHLAGFSYIGSIYNKSAIYISHACYWPFAGYNQIL